MGRRNGIHLGTAEVVGVAGWFHNSVVGITEGFQLIDGLAIVCFKADLTTVRPGGFHANVF